MTPFPALLFFCCAAVQEHAPGADRPGEAPAHAPARA
jgi:hypothetical protein